MLAALGLFVLIEVVGLLAAPLTALVLGRLPGAGLGFAKVFGLLLVTWLVWMAASLHIVAYGVPLIVGVLVLLALTSLLVTLRLRSLGVRAEDEKASRRLLRRALPLDDPVRRRLFWGAEAVFAVCYALGALLASFAPDVWNTEKPMDMAFITAINASSHFPPHDPWMSGESLNYYYLGHMVLAWPIELLGLRAGHRLPAGLGRAARPDRDRGLRVRGHAVGRGARDARSGRRAAGRCSPGWSPRRWWRSSATSRACAPGSAPRTRRATTPGSTRRG